MYARESDKKSERDVFKERFKVFSRKQQPVDNNVSVFDFDDDVLQEGVVRIAGTPVHLQPLRCLLPVTEWKIYGHARYPGFVFIRNPFKPGTEKYWIRRCLHDLPRKPNITNLSAVSRDVDSTSPISLTEGKPAGLGTCELGDNSSCMWCNRDDILSEAENSALQQLRWTTLGYHHNWDTKVYSHDSFTPFPEDIAYLSRYIAEAIGYADYRAEAAIVNYYHPGTTMSGHRDCSEEDHNAPLISISFGLPAIFLLGGLSREHEPIGMFVRSGDVVIMMGESRLAYHAVPRVFDTLAVDNASLRPSPCDTRQLRDKHRHRNATKNIASSATVATTAEQSNVKSCTNSNSDIDQSNGTVDSTCSERAANEYSAAAMTIVTARDKRQMVTTDVDSAINACSSGNSTTLSAILGKRKIPTEMESTESDNVSSSSDNRCKCDNRTQACDTMGNGARVTCSAIADSLSSAPLTSNADRYERFSVELLNSATSEAENNTSWKPYADYMRASRINMNIRQVFAK